MAPGLILAFTIFQARMVDKAARSQRKEKIRSQFGELAVVLPRTRAELAWFFAVSFTAGFCEEFVFRGYLIWAFQPWLGWWGAAVPSAVLFAYAHAYQGVGGAVRTGIVGVLMTLIVATFGSLWPAIVLHVLIGAGSGIMAWFVLREEKFVHPANL